MPGGSTDFQVRLRAVMDIGDVVSNIGAIQKSFSKLKLPEKLGANLNKNISEFYKEYEKYQKRIADGVKTQGDFNAVEKSLNRMKNLYGDIGKELEKTTKLSIDDIIDIGSGDFNKISNEISKMIQNINNVKIDTNAITKPLEEIRSLTKSKTVSDKGGLIDQIIGHVNSGNIAEAKNAVNSLQAYADKVATRRDAQNNLVRGTMGEQKYGQLVAALQLVTSAFDRADAEAAPFITRLNELQQELSETKSKASNDLLSGIDKFKGAEQNVEKVTDSLKRMHEEEFNFNRQAQDIDRQIQSYFGLSQMIRKVADIARDAFATVKELDAAMVETAVVTNFDVGDMWDMLPTYTANANQLGSTIKDVYEAATLYYQQGLNQAQSMGLANETLKMARIGGLQAAEATNMMTAALRGFNMEINQVSAKRINDVYSELAAITAADTKEIGSAMERTASIANSANMQFETTSAFLAQMIETTREAPENLGTAMKTIIARFQEMKQDPTKLVDSEGVALDANKIDTALKTIGVDLKNQKGEFRDLDTVFLEISEKWDSLTQGQQRYIATIAAGSRQQSRFIAMMQNYERVKELVDAANNSAGASQKQFEKTLDSMNSKLNKLKNAWDQFVMGFMNNQFLKGGVDALTGVFTVVNKLFNILTKPLPNPLEGLVKSALTLVSTLGMLQLGKKAARGGVMAGVGWWKNEGKFTENFKAGWGVGSKRKRDESGIIKQSKYGEAINQNIRKSNIAGTILKEFKKAQSQVQSIPWTTKIGVNNLIDRSSLNAEGKAAAHELWRALQEEVNKGNLTPDQALRSFRKGIQSNLGKDVKLNINPDVIAKAAAEAENATHKFDSFGMKISSAGLSLQQFGSALAGTPLEPFGVLLSQIGIMLVTVGDAAVATGRKIVVAFTEAKIASVAAGGGLNGLKTGIGTFIKTLTKLPPQLLIIIALLTAAAAVAYKFATADKKALEQSSDAAAAASEAFDSAKQETSELNDAISRIQENENAFDKLVAGTADFNEQMVTANEQITELLNKYPMLNDPKFLSTDKNGLMHISEAGLQAVKEYQKQVQAHASAMNIIQSADLAALENRQKASKLLQKITTDSDEREKNRAEAKLLLERAKADRQLAQRNAIRTTLNAKELKNVEAISAVYADLYDTKRKAASVEVADMSKSERRQAYADYHGYTYNKSTKKMRDTEGNEVDYDDKVIKDEVIEQTVMLDFEENSESLNGVLGHLDSEMKKTLGGAFDESGHVISDILSSNLDIDTDILEKIIGQPQDFQNIVNSLSDKEIATILGITEGEVKKNLDTYQDQVIDLLTNKATKLAEAQYESYADLAAMMAESYTTDKNEDTIFKKDIIKSDIQKLKTEQANLMSSIGKMLQENVGADAMSQFISQASQIFLGKDVEQSVKDEFTALVEGINWDSAASRLEGYNQAMQSGTEQIQTFGEAMRSSASEVNIVGEAFDEFVSGDWEKLSENADNFKNAMGQIDGAGIMEAAEQSKSLKSLLDSGEVSASAVAIALQGIEDGKYSVGAVDTAVLKLLSSLYKLEDVALEAHKIIENFDPGIDTGEGEDFVKENAEKAKEYYDNGEWGNQQLQNYIKLAAGTDKWNKTLQKNHGNLQETTKDLMKYVTTFKDGFGPAWEQMMSGKGINGKNLKDNVDKAIEEGRVDESLEKAFKKVTVSLDEEGYMDIDFGNLTTDELTTYFQEIYGVSKEYAQLLMQDLANYDGEVSALLQKNDLQAEIQSGKLDKGRTFDGRNTILTDAEIEVIKNAPGGAEALETIAKNLGYVSEIDKKTGEKLTAAQVMEQNAFKTKTDKGAEREDYDKLLQDYSKAFFKHGEQGIDNLLNNQTRLRDENGKLDLNSLITDMRAKSMSQEQSYQSAWELYQKGNGKNFSFDGIEFKQGIKSYEDFVAEIEKGPEHVQWYNIGQSIADGILSVINKEDTTSKTENNGSNNKSLSKTGETRDNERTGGKAQSNARDNLKGASSTIAGWFKSLLNPKDVPIEHHTPYHGTGGRRGSGGNANQSEVSTKDFFKINTDGIESSADTAGQTASNAAEQGASRIMADVGEGATRGVESGGKSKLGGRPRARKQFTDGQVANKGALEITRQPQEKQQTIPVSLVPEIKNEAEIKTTLQQKIKAILDSISQQKQPLNINANVKTGTKKTQVVSNSGKGGKAGKVTTGTQVMKVTANTAQAQSKINALINKFKKTYTLKYKASGPKRVNVPVYANFRGNWTKTVTINKSGAKGINNKLPYNALPALGSLARGTRYGRLGPRGRGGLTLTGEKGYEVAWLPSESRSMILGSKGPQMVNLPKDAVVYTHEQSEEILKKRQTIDAGSHARTGRRFGTGIKITPKNTNKGGSSGSSGSGSKKKKKETINNWSIQEAVRFNIDLELEEVTEEITRRTKEIEKTLEKINVRYGDVVDSTKDQIAALKDVINYNEKIRDSYQDQLNDYYKRQAIVSWTNSKGKSQNTKINISTYLNKDGSINQAALEKIDSRAKREAIFKEVSSAKTLTDGIKNANKAILDAQEQMEDLGEKISQTFYQWENELTEVYHLTQRINDETSFTSRFTSQIEMELAKLNAGFGETSKVIEDARLVLTRNNDIIQKQIEDQQQMIAARQRELDAALKVADEFETLQKYVSAQGMDEATQQENIDWAKRKYFGAELGRKYVTDILRGSDGSIQYNIDWEGFNRDRETNTFSKDTYEDIKKYLDTLNSAATEFNNAIKDQTDFIKDTYEALKEYQDYIASFEDSIIKGVEEEIQNETENAKKISESIVNSLKDLLDEVKRKLDERRKQEDNLKTERDISQKQQRLAALRADTAGGHQVEIAQLEKEIADAQQSYERTLEDQLLDRLSEQADKAAEQRERQIELAETSNEINAENNKALVNSWLADPTGEGVKEQLKAAWLEAQGYDEKGRAGQYVLEQEFEAEYAKLVTAVEQSGFNNAEIFSAVRDEQGRIKEDTGTLVTLLAKLNETQAELIGRADELALDFNPEEDVTKRNINSEVNSGLNEPETKFTPQMLKSIGMDAEEAHRNVGYNYADLIGPEAYSLKDFYNEGISAEELKAEGFTDVSALKEAGYEAKDLKGVFDFADLLDIYSDAELKEGGFNAADFAANNISYSRAKDTFSLKQLATADTYKDTIQKAYNDFLFNRGNKSSTDKNKGTLGKEGYGNQVQRGIALGKTQYQVAKELASTSLLNWKKVLKAAKAYGTTGKTVKNWNKKASKNSDFRKAFVSVYGKWSKFAQGGMADFTGPAWLDGTPSKPELVLNAADTKNFLALRDVLSKAVSSSNSISNTSGGDTYEININVDHINNDYDVDRIADRVKKNIMRDAGYRNVTQVRNFR